MSMYTGQEYDRLKKIRVEVKRNVADHYAIEGMMNCGMCCVGNMSLEEVAEPAPFTPGGWETEEQYNSRARAYGRSVHFEEAMSRVLTSLMCRMNDNGMMMFSDSIQEPLGDDGGDFRDIGMRHLAEYMLRNTPQLIQEGPCVWNNGGDGWIQHWTLLCSESKEENYKDLLENNDRQQYNEREEDEDDDYY